jgi:hypothetical protein
MKGARVMGMENEIHTTANERFTAAESRELARLILKRWGNDLPAAACAWRRLMQNNCSDAAFQRIVESRS